MNFQPTSKQKIPDNLGYIHSMTIYIYIHETLQYVEQSIIIMEIINIIILTCTDTSNIPYSYLTGFD